MLEDEGNKDKSTQNIVHCPIMYLLYKFDLSESDNMTIATLKIQLQFVFVDNAIETAKINYNKPEIFK